MVNMSQNNIGYKFKPCVRLYLRLHLEMDEYLCILLKVLCGLLVSKFGI